jgi:signal transduction histidine kinase
MIMKDHIHIPVSPQEIDTLSFVIILCHNFMFIIYAHYHFFKVFNNTINKLNRSTEELTRYNQFQKQLIASITHDIKSPLKYLMITSESLNKGMETDPMGLETGLKAIHSSSFQMYHFTNNLLEYARAHTIDGNIPKEEISLHQLVQEKSEIFKDIAMSYSTTVRNEVDPLLKLNTSKPLLSVIIHNLLDNALKYTINGHILFTGYRDGPGTIILAIRDTGMGMDAAMQNWCNQPDSTIHPNGSGGLGLTIVKELLGMIGGSLHVHCPPAGGTSVSLSFTEP